MPKKDSDCKCKKGCKHKRCKCQVHNRGGGAGLFNTHPFNPNPKRNTSIKPKSPFAAHVTMGRPCKVNDDYILPKLCTGKFSQCESIPIVNGIAQNIKEACNAFWLESACAEYASVPAFSKVIWDLCAIGANSELISWGIKCAGDEVKHARLCLALAESYGGVKYTFQENLDMLTVNPVPRRVDDIIRDTVLDGCLHEAYSAKVAEYCSSVCLEPNTQVTLNQIAPEERSHELFSWACLLLLEARYPQQVKAVCKEILSTIHSTPYPRIYSDELEPLINKLSPRVLGEYGIIDKDTSKELYDQQIMTVKERLTAIVYFEPKLNRSAVCTEKRNKCRSVLWDTKNTKNTNTSIKIEANS